jgi:Fe-S cluster assembly iron-binding protein IscA
MVRVTPQAARHLSETRDQRGLSRKAGVRFVRHGSGVGLTFSGQPAPGDTKITAPGIEVFLAPEIADKLDGSTIDVGESEGQTKLYVRPPASGASTSQQHRTS